MFTSKGATLLPAEKGVRRGHSEGALPESSLPYRPGSGNAFKVRDPRLRQRLNSFVSVIEGKAAAGRINHAVQRQAIRCVNQIKRDAGVLFDRRAP